jgi:hypothetical protein
MMSTTTDPAIATSFTHIRALNGRQHVGQTPLDALVIECQLEYDVWPQQGDGPLFKAQEMEDKWDVYQWNGQLYVARS